MKQFSTVVALVLGSAVTTCWCDDGSQSGPQVFTTRPDAKTKLVPLPKEEGVFHFAIFGDRTGGPAEGIRVLEQAVEDTNLLDPDLVMTVGDLINGYNQRPEWLEQMKEYRSSMADLDMPWFPVAGNHDIYWRGPNRPDNEHEADYEMHFGPLWYAFRHKNAGFIAMFSDEGDLETGEKSFNGGRYQNVSPEQMEFIKQALERLNDCDHVFLFLHHPRWFGGDNYGGSNWDRVHTMLAEAGNVSAVFGGHIHQMTYAGKQDGIEYFTLAAVGAHLSRELPQAGYLHHLNVVTVREKEFHVAAIPVGTVLDPREFTVERIQEIQSMVSKPVKRKSPPITLALGDGPSRGTYRVQCHNSASHPLEVTLVVDGLGAGWTMVPDHEHFVIGPGENRIAAFRFRSTSPVAADFSRPRLRIRIEYLGETGRLALPEQSVPINVNVKTKGPAPAVDQNRVVDLSGEGALKIPNAAVTLPDGPFTLEAWIKPTALKDDQSIIAKTQHSEYSLSLNEGKPNFAVHLDGQYVHTTAGDPIATDTWTHLAGVFTGSETVLYVNGEPAARNPAQGARRRNKLPLYVGADPNEYGQPSRRFAGFIDGARLSRGARYQGAFMPAQSLAADDKTLFAFGFDYAVGPYAIDASPKHVPAEQVGQARLVPKELTVAP